MADCLNPFMNQVYFYAFAWSIEPKDAHGLNPFMNQVYFYNGTIAIGGLSQSLNPFMNQVYFYDAQERKQNGGDAFAVLIPL